MKKNSILLKGALLSFSSTMALLSAELLLRLLFNPVDYLRPELIADHVLGYRVEQNSAGHDAWGYRNRAKPDTADIVCIGDSQTYGVSATAFNSYPAQLQKITESPVYNISLGGYGPPQYSYLLKKQALKLKPKKIIMGLYFGNDFLDTFSLIYHSDTKAYWHAYHSDSLHTVKQKNVHIPTVAFRPLRTFLEHNSMLYRMVIYSKIGDIFRLFTGKALSEKNPNLIALNAQHIKYPTVLAPYVRFKSLNRKSSQVKFGSAVSMEIVKESALFCKENDIDFYLLFIPTKESVYAPVLANELNAHPVLASLIEDERYFKEQWAQFCTKQGIPYLDLTKTLQSSVNKIRLYPQHHDGHPVKAGYKLIAEQIAVFITH